METELDQGGEWQMVNNQQKKAQKKKKSKENQQKDKANRTKEKEKEEMEREAKREAFMQQYVYKQSAEGTLSSSMFDAFRDGNSKKSLLKNDMVSAKDFEPTEEERRARAAAKQAKKPKAPKKPAVTEVAKTIDATQLKETLNQYSERFPNNHELQVKGLAEQLETIFNNADTKKLVAAEADKPYLQSLEFPYSLLQKEVHETIKVWLDKFPEESLVSFFSFLITTYISIAIDKNFELVTSGLGVKYLIQFVVRNYPQVLVKSIPLIKQSYTETKNDVANMTVTILKKNYASFFVWVFGQSIEKLAAGLTVWFHFMLPLIFNSGSQESVRESSLVFIENLVQTKARTFMEDTNAVMGFERLMLYSAEKSFSPRLKAVTSSKLLNRSFLFGEKNVTRRFFAMLLGHAATSKPALRDIVFANLVECLEKDPSIYTFWSEIYVNTIAQSNNLLLYITLNWEGDNLHKRLKADTILQTAKTFTAFNKQLLAGTYLPPGDKKKKPKKVTDSSEVKEVNMMTATCKALRDKLQGYATAPTKESSSEDSAGGGLLLSILPLGILVAGAVAYTAMNCCKMDWCVSNPTLSELLKC